MVKRIYRSKTDIENLSKLRTSISDDIDNFNYKRLVVEKPWGYEYLMFENLHVAIWILHLKYNHATSMHCHPNKKSSLIILSGNVICSTLEGWVPRITGEGLIIDEAVFHSTKAISKKGAFIMEIESPPNKKDLVRLNDMYGRENQGYEGVEKMSKDVFKYQYVDFHDDTFLTKKFKGCSLSICNNKKPFGIHKTSEKKEKKLVCILKGQLHDNKGNMLLAAGEIESLLELLSKKPIIISNDSLYLLLTWKNNLSNTQKS